MLPRYPWPTGVPGGIQHDLQWVDRIVHVRGTRSSQVNMKAVVLTYWAITVLRTRYEITRLGTSRHHCQGAAIVHQFDFGWETRRSCQRLVPIEPPNGDVAPRQIPPTAVQRGELLCTTHFQRWVTVSRCVRLEKGIL